MSDWILNEDGKYADLEYTNFPASCDNWTNSEDISSSLIGAANQYRAAMENGNYTNAQAVLNSNPRLRNALINADTINRLKHSIMAVERMFTSTIESYIKRFTDAAQNSANKAKESEVAAKASSDIASQKRDESLQIVEDLKTLKGTLPTDFTDYADDIADARNYIDETIQTHNTDEHSHADIRASVEELRTTTESHKHDAADIQSGIIPIERGGTGGDTAIKACISLGALPLSGGIMNGTLFFGSTNYYVNNSGVAVFSKAYGAVYNDYAELFPRGGTTQPGDIIALDTDSQTERYVRADDTSKRVVGVHTDEYAMLIGGDLPSNGSSLDDYNIDKYIPVSLAGRVRVRVIGKVKTGDLIVPSKVPGIGRAVEVGEVVSPDIVVGYAVEGDDLFCERRIRVRVKG
nr:MAG TPA: Preneck appendage protein barrel, VIRAL PROTEIN.8A [Herelleviridae sp.]